MYAVLLAIVHAAISGAASLAIAPYSADPVAAGRWMWSLGLFSALLCATGFVAISLYLGRRVKLVSGLQVGLLCGLLCAAILWLVLAGLDYSLVVYLALLVPALVAVLLASLLDRPRSGWQA